jgi:dienelactone hydrolase
MTSRRVAFVLLLVPALLFVEGPRPAWADKPAAATAIPDVQDVRASFKKLLDRPLVPLDPKTESKSETDGLITEKLTFASEKRGDGKEERVPVLIVRPAKADKRLPAMIILHGTGGNKEGVHSWLIDLAKRGILGVAIDARYHGARAGGAKGATAYNEAITRAWQTKQDQPQEHPFYYDTCWDLWRTLDYLQSRPDVDPARIGMGGISMGGIETWLAATVDERVKVLVPMIGVQSFRWSLENDKWQARANTIKAAHEAAAKDLGEKEVNAKVCRALWDKVIPGILGPFDCPSMLRLAAGRPLLILSGEQDPNCPLPGAQLAIAAAEKAYEEANAKDKLRVVVAKGIKHQVTSEMHDEAIAWCVKWLNP